MSNAQHLLNRILAVTGRPVWMKSAASEEAIPNSAYADLWNRRLPCHTKEAAFISCLIGGEEGVDEEVGQSLAKFARFWGIDADVKAAQEKLAASKHQIPIEDMPDQDFALVAEHQGSKVRKYASVDAGTTYDAAIAFHENRAKYPYAWRKEAATKLLERAQRYQTILPAYVSEYLHKAAGFAVATQNSIDDAVIERVNRAPKSFEGAAEKLAGLMDEFATNPSLRYNSELMGGLLETMDQFDRETKIASVYGHGLDLPEEMLVHTEPTLSKLAGASQRFATLVNGREVDVSLLPPDALESVGEGLSKMAHAKLCEILPTLPKPEADLLCELMPKTAAVGPAGMAPAMKAPPAAPAAPALSNSLTDDNFDQQTALAATMPPAPMVTPTVPSPTANIPLPSGPSLADNQIATAKRNQTPSGFQTAAPTNVIR